MNCLVEGYPLAKPSQHINVSVKLVQLLICYVIQKKKTIFSAETKIMQKVKVTV